MLHDDSEYATNEEKNYLTLFVPNAFAKYRASSSPSLLCSRFSVVSVYYAEYVMGE
jgi:hypothetical protein